MAATKKTKQVDTRDLLMQGIWGCVAGKASWRKWAPESNSPIPKAIARILEAGANEEDVYALVRYMQAEALYNMCQVLDDPSFGAEEPLPDGRGWSLVETHDEKPGKKIDEIHASFHEADPEGS